VSGRLATQTEGDYLMTYHVTRRWGATERTPSAVRMREILNELDASDFEHPCTWLTHESGWTLLVYESGTVTWEFSRDEVAPRHLVDVPREQAHQLWLLLSTGDIEQIERNPWRLGASPPLTEEEAAAIAQVAAEMTLESNRNFYDKLGPERPGVRCRAPGCARGAIELSIYCRPHHYERLYHQPCPFTD